MAYNKPCAYCSQQSSTVQATCPLVLAYDIPTLCINEPPDPNIVHLQNEFWYTFIQHVWSSTRMTTNDSNDNRNDENTTLTIPTESFATPTKRSTLSPSSLSPTPYTVTPFLIEQYCYPTAGFRPSNIGKVLYRLSRPSLSCTSSSSSSSTPPVLIQRSSLCSLNDCLNYHQRSKDNNGTTPSSTGLLSSLVLSSSSFVMSALTASFSALSLLIPPTSSVPDDIDETTTNPSFSTDDTASTVPTDPNEEYVSSVWIDTVIVTLLTTAKHYGSSSSFPNDNHTYIALYLYDLPTNASTLTDTLTTEVLPLSLPELCQRSSALRFLLVPTSPSSGKGSTILLHESVYQIIIPRLVMQGYGTIVLDTSMNTGDNHNKKVLILSTSVLTNRQELPTITEAITTSTSTTTMTTEVQETPTSNATNTPLKSPLPHRTIVSPSPYASFSPLRPSKSMNNVLVSPSPSLSIDTVPATSTITTATNTFSLHSSLTTTTTTPILPVATFTIDETTLNKTLSSLSIHHHLHTLHQRIASYDTLITRLLRQATQAKRQNQIPECKFYLKRKLMIEQAKQSIYSKILNIETITLAIHEAADNIAQMTLLEQANTTLKQLSSTLNTEKIENTVLEIKESIDDIHDVANIVNQDMMMDNGGTTSSTLLNDELQNELDHLDEWFAQQQPNNNNISTLASNPSFSSVTVPTVDDFPKPPQPLPSNVSSTPALTSSSSTSARVLLTE